MGLTVKPTAMSALRDALALEKNAVDNVLVSKKIVSVPETLIKSAEKMDKRMTMNVWQDAMVLSPNVLLGLGFVTVPALVRN